MTGIFPDLAALRHRSGRAYTLVRDHVLGVTRSVVFQVSCDSNAGLSESSLVTFRRGGRADLEAFTEETHDYGKAEKKFGFERLERGDSLMIGESGGGVVFYAWLMYGQMDLDEDVCIPITPEAAYSYRVFTIQHARGLRVCAAYYTFLKKFLAGRGYGRLICRITPHNTASIRAHARVGFKRCGLLWKVVTPGHAFYHANAEMQAWLPEVAAARYFDHHGWLKKHEERPGALHA